MVRLDKFLADAGIGTRSEVKKYIRSGWVVVNDIPARDGGEKIDPKTAQVFFRGEPVRHEAFSYYMLHKASGTVTAKRDRERTVMDVFPAHLQKILSPVGRLDKDTEGLLLLTNDGALNHHLTSPAHHVKKRYYAILDKKIPETAAGLFVHGVDIGDEKPTLPAELEILPSGQPFDSAFSGEGCDHAILTISEGRYHQVRRMFEAVGCHVLYLKRLSLGGLFLGDLERNSYRKLTEQEVAMLKQPE